MFTWGFTPEGALDHSSANSYGPENVPRKQLQCSAHKFVAPKSITWLYNQASRLFLPERVKKEFLACEMRCDKEMRKALFRMKMLLYKLLYICTVKIISRQNKLDYCLRYHAEMNYEINNQMNLQYEKPNLIE